MGWTAADETTIDKLIDGFQETCEIIAMSDLSELRPEAADRLIKERFVLRNDRRARLLNQARTITTLLAGDEPEGR